MPTLFKVGQEIDVYDVTQWQRHGCVVKRKAVVMTLMGDGTPARVSYTSPRDGQTRYLLNTQYYLRPSDALKKCEAQRRMALNKLTERRQMLLDVSFKVREEGVE